MGTGTTGVTCSRQFWAEAGPLAAPPCQVRVPEPGSDISAFNRFRRDRVRCRRARPPVRLFLPAARPYQRCGLDTVPVLPFRCTCCQEEARREAAPASWVSAVCCSTRLLRIYLALPRSVRPQNAALLSFLLTAHQFLSTGRGTIRLREDFAGRDTRRALADLPDPTATIQLSRPWR